MQHDRYISYLAISYVIIDQQLMRLLSEQTGIRVRDLGGDKGIDADIFRQI